MVLTANQTTTFLEDAGHMGIPHRTVVQMQQEGIITVDDIAEFEKETIETLSSNLRRPSGRVQDPNAAAPERSLHRHLSLEPSLRQDWLWQRSSFATT